MKIEKAAPPSFFSRKKSSAWVEPLRALKVGEWLRIECDSIDQLHSLQANIPGSLRRSREGSWKGWSVTTRREQGTSILWVQRTS